ncbi:MAG: hypothetical protein KC474_06575 [Cyanobacteria bacterium HKST-UBA04]|nr:hypothetical protein [Cyanobacteria bacterium HKST-UBA04]
MPKPGAGGDEPVKQEKAEVTKQDQSIDSRYLKVDRRYRESEYFLADQLRYAEAVQEFRSVKNAMLNSSQFSLADVAFRFARAMGTD